MMVKQMSGVSDEMHALALRVDDVRDYFHHADKPPAQPGAARHGRLQTQGRERALRQDIK